MFTTQSLESNGVSHEFDRDLNILSFVIQNRAFGYIFTTAVRSFEKWVYFYLITCCVEVNSPNLSLYLLTVQLRVTSNHLLGLM
jgi:hypothetical protein